MRSRFAAIVVLAAAVALGTSGCGLLAPQATTIHYDASDGVSGTVGDVELHNALIVADEEGTAGNLVVSLVNTGTSAHNVEITWGDDGKASVTVDAGETITLSAPQSGDAETEDVLLDPLPAKPGDTTDVFFQYGSETGATLQVPILTGDLAEYSTLVPTPKAETTEPEATTEPETTSTPEPTETSTPTE